MKLAVLSLGLWLAGAQGMAAQACCSPMPVSNSACDDCGDPSERDSSSRPDCCTSLEAPKDLERVLARNSFPEPPVLILLLPIDPAAAWHPETSDQSSRKASLRAEGPPLYLRNSVLLI